MSIDAAISAALAPKQVLSIADADARVNLWHGSVRSGKTIGSLLAFLIAVAHAPAGGEIVVVGRTRESIARNVFGPLSDVSIFGALARQVSYTAGAPTGKILGRTVHVLGASDARAEMVLRGLTVGLVYVDEATLVAEAFWTQLLARLSVPGARLFATTNPDGPAHWLKRQVVDRADELGYRIFHFGIEDNEYLVRTNPAYIAQLKREYIGLWYRRFILGEWVQAEGAIYDTWDPARHVVTAEQLPAMDQILLAGVDYGDVHATRGYLLGLGPDPVGGGYRLYVLSEWAPGRMTIGQHSTDLRRWLAEQPPGWRDPAWVAVDSAAASFKHQLFHDGMVNVRNAHKNVLAGIRTVSAALAVDKLVVVDSCTQLIERLPGYVWDEKATKRGDTKPKKEADDEVDALRYAVYTSRHDWADMIPLAPADAPDQDSDVDDAA